MIERKFTRDSLVAFFKEFYRIWISERPGPLAGSLAYFGVFSVIPITYIAVTMAGFFIDASAMLDQLMTFTETVLGPEVTQTIQIEFAELAERTSQGSTLTSVISFVVLLFTASLIFFQLQYVLNNVWRVPPPTKDGTRAFIKNRLLAFVMVLGVGPLLILATMVSIVMSFFSSLLGIERIIVVLTFFTYLGLATLSLAVIYKYLPNVEIAWRDVWIGSLVTAIMITMAIYLLGLYLSIAEVSSALQAAGTAAVFLIAFYFFAVIFVIGAVFTRVYASVFGSKIVPLTNLPSQHQDSP
jgi:membrane protein